MKHREVRFCLKSHSPRAVSLSSEHSSSKWFKKSPPNSAAQEEQAGVKLALAAF